MGPSTSGREPPRPRIVSVQVSPSASPATAATAPRTRGGNPVTYVLARGCAFAIDVLVVTLVATELAYAAIAINPFTGLPSRTEAGFDATLGLGLAVALAYVWVAEGLLGTTLGKLLFGLHVYPVRGRRAGLGRAFVRGLLRPLDLLGIGPVLALLPGRRRLGDLAGGTIVARGALGTRGSSIAIVALLVLLGVPFVLAGVGRTFAAMYAFVEFFPHLVAHGWSLLRRMGPG